ncbi:unnamed protein product [Pleuronectes platessa]|uniref:Uncharacterized protein n=1 Tax=Pleuronectes platessa TaxID=8262 RepID=A0A9N7UM18_PLEPL|nr:unnamed protein product [Pleuronectes platessa]
MRRIYEFFSAAFFPPEEALDAAVMPEASSELQETSSQVASSPMDDKTEVSLELIIRSDPLETSSLVSLKSGVCGHYCQVTGYEMHILPSSASIDLVDVQTASSSVVVLFS